VLLAHTSMYSIPTLIASKRVFQVTWNKRFFGERV
jgi:hypothetical protein